MTASVKFRIFFLLVLLLNILLKFYGIDKNSLWLDEAYSVNEAQMPVSMIIDHSSKSDNPPLYYILLHLWTNVFGISELAVRSLSAVFNILAVMLIFIFVARKFNLFTGIFSALFFTFSKENLFYAQETRTYALIVFLTVVSIGCFLELYRRKNILLLAILSVANICLAYSHYLSIFIPLLELCIAFFYFNKNRYFFKRIFLSTIIFIVCFLPWMQYPLSHAPKEGSFWLHKPTFSNFKGILIDIAGNKISLIFCFIILAFAVFRKYKLRGVVVSRTSFDEISLLTFAFAPIIITYIIAGFTPIFLVRYLLFVSVPFYILFLVLLNNYISNRKLVTIFSVMLIFSSLLSFRLHPTKDENWREAVSKVKELKGNNSVVVLSASYTENVFSYYFDKNLFINYKSRRISLLKDKILPVKANELNSSVDFRNCTKIIGVFCHELDEDSENKIRKRFDSEFKTIESFDFEKVKVILYEKLMY